MGRETADFRDESPGAQSDEALGRRHLLLDSRSASRSSALAPRAVAVTRAPRSPLPVLPDTHPHPSPSWQLFPPTSAPGVTSQGTDAGDGTAPRAEAAQLLGSSCVTGVEARDGVPRCQTAGSVRAFRHWPLLRGVSWGHLGPCDQPAPLTSDPSSPSVCKSRALTVRKLIRVRYLSDPHNLRNGILLFSFYR